MSILLGPTDADHFRIRVGRYKDRWYVDPLPDCTIAPAAPDWQGPAFSATKTPFANKYVPMRAIADMPSEEWARLAGIDADGRYEAIKAHEYRASKINMARGTIVHKWAEDRLLGRTAIPGLDMHPAKALEQAERFRPALDAFFDAYQPELVAAEVVCIHRSLNGVGYGCTVDAFVKIDGEIWDIDWKSRNSEHAAYLEEAAQGGAGVGAEYMIVAGPDGAPVRAPVPKVAGVLIVSIREDGYRVYPIDADRAVTAYAEMHRWWAAQQAVDGLIGKPWAPKVAPTEAPPLRDQLVARARELVDAGHGERLARHWPVDVPGFRTNHQHTDAELIEIRTAIRRTATDVSLRFDVTDADPKPTPAPEPVPEPDLPPAAVEAVDDGEVVSAEARADLNARYAGLKDRSQVDAVRVALNPRTTPDGRPFERHWSILRAAVLWAEAGWDDEIVRDLTSAVTNDEAVRQPGIDLAVALAALTIEQANELAEMALRVLEGTYSAEHQDRWTLVPAA